MNSPSLCRTILCTAPSLTGSLLLSSCGLFETKEIISFDSRPYKTIALSTEPGYMEAASAKALRNKGYKVLREWNEKDKPNAYLTLKKEKTHSCKDSGGRNRHYSLIEGQLHSSNGTLIWEAKGDCLTEDFESYSAKSSLRSAAVRTVSFLPYYGDYPGMPPREDN